MTVQDQAMGGGQALELALGEPVAEPTLLPTLLLTLVALLTMVDIHLDHDMGVDFEHLAVEVVMVVVAVGGAALVWWKLRRARRHNRALAQHLVAARADAQRHLADLEGFRSEAQEHARGLGAAIDRQFERWGLSPAEREVALLLLEGLSHRESAEVRATSERTVRQQALSVYRKAGLTGRAELAAFFLEDLLRAPATRSRPEGT